MARFDALIVSRQRHQVALAIADRHPTGVDVVAASGLRHSELLEQHPGFGKFEIVARIFLLGLLENVAIGDLLLALTAVEVEVEEAVDALHVHRAPVSGELTYGLERLAF